MTQDNAAVLGLMTNFWSEKNAAVHHDAQIGRAGLGAQARNSRHMRDLSTFVHQMFVDAGLDESDVHTGRTIPGFYQRSKNWDVVATHKGYLVGILELKSQVGSEGKNGHNRIEEAIGNAVDATTIQEMNQIFGPLLVWKAFCIVFCSDPSLATRVRMQQRPLYETDPLFDAMTYVRHWENSVERFIQTTSTTPDGWPSPG